ncbi:MAG: SusC/RagA family TonB-linked outer membrane protein [Flavisolibacter sp.]
MVVCLTMGDLAYSQSITFSLKNAPIEAAFKEIQTQSGYHFVYTTETLRDSKPVSLSVKSAPFVPLLAQLFTNQPLAYKVEDQYILVNRKKEEQQHEVLQDVSGTIIDQKGQPIPGASIIVRDKKKATSSDRNGAFTLRGLERTDLLIISSVGFRTMDFQVDGQTHVVIRMEVYVSALDETVIIAYGATTNRLNTGSISKVNSENIQQQPVSNPLQAISARMPGVYIKQTSGIPGGDISIVIRGVNSLRTNGNFPLYLIDGIPFTATSLSSSATSQDILRGSGGNPLNSLNPNDIESIEVLKDADATAIYGSRGANGVVLITTKKGKTGKTQLDLDASQGIAQVAHQMDMLHTSEYLAMRREAFANDGAQPQVWDYDVNGAWDSTRYTDWQKTIIGNSAHTTNLYGSLSGGNAGTKFLLGGGYYKETTVFPGSFAYEKGSGHFNLNHTSTNQKLRLSLTSSIMVDRNFLPSKDITSLALSLSPDAPAATDENGNLNWANNTWPLFGSGNPFALLKKTYQANSDNVITHTNFSYYLLPGLEVKLDGGFSLMHRNEIQKNPLSSYNPAFHVSSGYAVYANNSLSTWILEPQLDYKRFIGKGQMNILIGTTIQQNVQTEQSLMGFNYLNDALLENIQAAQTVRVSASNYTLYKYSALFGRLSYTWMQKYLFNFTGRRDGSSRFGPGKQFANFGAIGAGWIFSNEKFLDKIKSVLSFGKFRFSYGITGNDQIGDYQFLSTYSPTAYPYDRGGLIPTRLLNPNFAWETNKKMEGALELGVKNRINITIGYFRNRSSNQLVGYSLPLITGFSSVQANLAATVQNTGWEVDAQWTNIESKNFSWTSSINGTFPHNQLLSYPGIEGSTYASVYAVGKPLGILHKLNWTGIDPKTGIYTFQDVNGDGLVDDKDYQFSKTLGQDFYGGFQNSIHLGGWQLDFLIQYVKQTGQNYTAFFGNPGSASNQPTAVMNHWQKNGDLTDIGVFTQNYGSGAYGAYSNAVYNSDYIVCDASFLRLKNLSLSYQLSGKWLQKCSLENCKIYVQGENLLTITPYTGLDPEFQTASRVPPLRVISAGIQLKF